ncbi:MAG: RidA family protein [Gloeomargaritaceae cyanobacterium C42_A2020_066]|nr:RidA family protein [Gloeomargaritaceae cyanobacterium C42_A2020_066]
MTHQVIVTEHAPQPIGPYSQAIKGCGTWVFLAGQIALHPQTGALVGGEDAAAQAEQVMENLGAVLAASGATWAEVVKTTVYLVDLADFVAVNQVYGRHFGLQPGPARACVQVAALPKGARVEIDAIALLPEGVA